MGLRTRVPSRLPREGDSLGNRAQDSQGEAIRRLAKNLLLDSVIVSDVVFAAGLRVAAVNPSLTNADDQITATTYGEGGALVPAVATTNKYKRVDFGVPIGAADTIVLRASQAAAGPWWNMLDVFPHVSVTGVGSNERGAWWEPVSGSASAIDVYFAGPGAAGNVAWGVYAAGGWRWKAELHRASMASATAVSGEDVQIEHGLGRRVEGFVVVEASGPGVIFQSPADNPAPERLFFLRASAPLTASILFF